MEPLTPGHFLIGHLLLAIPKPAEDVPIPMRQQWWLLQQIVNSHWKIRQLEYLNTPQQCAKWQQEVSNVKEGMAVVLMEETSLSQWWLGRIIRALPDKVGCVSLVKLLTKDGSYLSNCQ